MSCCDCLDGPPESGVEDAGTEGAYLLKVVLSTGLEVRVHVLPNDTIARVNEKVEAVHGVQPDVVIQGRMVHPPLCAKWEGKWLPVRDDVTMTQLGMQTKLKYADITDQLDKVKAFANAHWAASNTLGLGVGIARIA